MGLHLIYRYIYLGRMYILTVFSLPAHEIGISLFISLL